MQLYLYADHESADLLASARPKALLIGSDFGNGNFGDVLQHLGSVSLVRARTDFAIVSLCVLDAISRHADAASLRERYGVDAVVFVTEVPIEADVAAGLGLCPVQVLCNLSYVQLYGGGFLNEMWGEFVLGIAEQFLGRLPGVPYAISGQQISSAFVSRVQAHVEKFAPRLVGARDRASLDLVTAGGMLADFSFDDAVEPLLDLGRRLELRAGDGAFIHLNTSDYTGNDAALTEMVTHLQLVAARIGSQDRPVLFQAFQDAREVVVDSIETVKRLDAGFPFADVETVLLVTSMLGAQTEGAQSRLLTGRFGYSSSYHVTLWLQLCGIPCWLRGSNAYYEQKRAALGIEGKFEDFLEHMQCPDHGGSLQARSLWLDKLQQVMESIEPATNRIEWELPDNITPTRPFNFKGEPRYEQQLREAWRAREDSEQEVGRLGAALKTQLLGAEDQILELNRLIADRQQRIAEQEQRITEQELALAEARMSLLACNEQITAVGHDARHYHNEYQRVHSNLQDVATREREIAARMQEILCSRSWRWTRPFRVGTRYLRTGRFDPAGKVGLFGALRAIGRRVPISQSLRSSLGEILARFRRH